MIKIVLEDLSKREEIFSAKESKRDVSLIVTEIIEKVKKEGDKAIIELCEKFDKAKLTTLKVSEEEIETAYNKVEK